MYTVEGSELRIHLLDYMHMTKFIELRKALVLYHIHVYKTSLSPTLSPSLPLSPFLSPNIMLEIRMQYKILLKPN